MQVQPSSALLGRHPAPSQPRPPSQGLQGRLGYTQGHSQSQPITPASPVCPRPGLGRWPRPVSHPCSIAAEEEAQPQAQEGDSEDLGRQLCLLLFLSLV